MQPFGNSVSVCFSSLPCVSNSVPFFFQNGLVTSSPEMFKLKSCIRRKTDSIDKRFCFDIEVVERFEHCFPLCSFYLISVSKFRPAQHGTIECLQGRYQHVYFTPSRIYSMPFHCVMFTKAA